uniref:Uncharacterized protein n=1 Tax=viral metagenome TaxID=1070528 RepID=A0A6C0DQ53_9ZZZZ
MDLANLSKLREDVPLDDDTINMIRSYLGDT